jgi:predicted RNA-binding protein with PIN domain
LLIDALIEYGKRKSHNLIVVFDGWRTGQGQESRSVTGGVRVIYSRLGDKADSVIKRMISAERREWIVVTSDREIADHAWSTGSIPVSSDDFLKALSSKDLPGIEEEDEEEYIEPRRKGSPRQLSKKEKAIKRAISKL